MMSCRRQDERRYMSFVCEGCEGDGVYLTQAEQMSG